MFAFKYLILRKWGRRYAKQKAEYLHAHFWFDYINIYFFVLNARAIIIKFRSRIMDYLFSYKLETFIFSYTFICFSQYRIERFVTSSMMWRTVSRNCESRNVRLQKLEQKGLQTVIEPKYLYQKFVINKHLPFFHTCQLFLLLYLRVRYIQVLHKGAETVN